MAIIQGYTAESITNNLNKIKEGLKVQNGGTGLSSIPNNAILMGNTANILKSFEPDRAGFLKYTGTGWGIQNTQLTLDQGGTNTTELTGKNSLLVSVAADGLKLEAVTAKILSISTESELINSTDVLTGQAFYNSYKKLQTSITTSYNQTTGNTEYNWNGNVLSIDKIPPIPAYKITVGIGEDPLPIACGGTGATNIEGIKNILQLGPLACIPSNGVVPIENGGTGASTDNQARINLGLGAVAIENVVPINKGGTGLNSLTNNSLVLTNNNGSFNFLNYNLVNNKRNYILTTENDGTLSWKTLTDIIQQTNSLNVTNGVLSSSVGGTGINGFDGQRVIHFLNQFGYYNLNYDSLTGFENIYISPTHGGVPSEGNINDFLVKTANSYHWQPITIRNVPNIDNGNIIGQVLAITDNNEYNWLSLTNEIPDPSTVSQGYVLMADGEGGYGWQQLQIDESGNTQTIQIDLTTNDVSGILPENKGGTGVNSFTTAFNTAYNSHYKEISTMQSYSLTMSSTYNNKLIIFNGTRNGTINLPPNNETLKGLSVQIFNKTSYDLTITPPQNSNCIIYFKGKGQQNTTYIVDQYETITLFYLGSNEWIIY